MNTENPFPVSTPAAQLFDVICGLIDPLPLVPGTALVPDDLVSKIRDATSEDLLDSSSGDEDAVACIRAGLLLRADRLEESHAVSQKISSPDGSYWHGIMHRREPDYGNSKYWFGRTGNHPVFARLSMRSLDEGTDWDPYRFIDLCEACTRGRRPGIRSQLEDLQEAEIRALLAHNVRQALGEPR